MSKRLCTCGCDNFRFRITTDEANFYEEVCRNCSHPLTEHINIIRSHQSE